LFKNSNFEESSTCGSFDMLFLVLQGNYFEKISLMGFFSLVGTNMS